MSKLLELLEKLEYLPIKPAAISFIVLAFFVSLFYTTTLFTYFMPSIIWFVAEKWIAPKCKPKEVAQIFISVMVVISYIVGYLDEKCNIDILSFLFHAMIRNSAVFVAIAFFIALIPAMCRLVERQTICTMRNGKISKTDMKCWNKDSLITNISGWIAMCAIIRFTLLQSGIENYKPLFDSSNANELLRVFCLTCLCIVFEFAAQQQNQEYVPEVFNDDKEKDFSLTSVAQFTNMLWLFLVGVVCIICGGYIFSYNLWLNQLVFPWYEFIILSGGFLPFFVTCSFQPEHGFVYWSAFVVGTPVILIFQAIYVVIGWDKLGASHWIIVIPIVFLLLHIIFVLIQRKKHLEYFKNAPVFCIAYFCAALSSLSFVAVSHSHFL
jgi:hypothetical protein